MQEKTKDCESEVENMAKFGINDILNAKTKAAGQQAQTEGYKEIYLSPYEVKAAQENTHQKLENIEELADSFLHVGQEQPTVLARVNGEYRIIDGHRRNAANILNLERGHKEYEKVLYRFMDMSEAMYELRLLAGNGFTQELTAYEKTRLVERTKAALIRAKEEDGLEIQGEKMEHLPSEGNTEHKQHEIKIVASYYEDVVSGKKGFELRKNDRGYKQGDSLKMLEFKDGKHTGRTIDADIIYMLEDYTGLTEGYCILGIRVTDYTGKVSETDTESGAEHE